MQPVTLSDLSAAARALMAVPPPARAALMRHLMAQAALADRHRRRTGQCPPSGGNGTLMAAALALPHLPHQKPGDRAYLACLHLALDVLLKGERREG